MISERPELLTLDAQDRPHNDTGPCCRWRDGSALYSVHGVRVPRWLIERPELLTIEKIKSVRNDEVKRVMINRYGAGKWLEDSGAKPIKTDDWGTLYDMGLYRVVKLINSTEDEVGRRREYYRNVPSTCGSPRAAIAWSYGMEEQEYNPAVMT